MWKELRTLYPDYHFVCKDVEGASTQWDNIQTKLGNLFPKPQPFKPAPFAPAENEESKPKDKAWIDEKTEEELEDDLDDDRFLEYYSCSVLESSQVLVEEEGEAGSGVALGERWCGQFDDCGDNLKKQKIPHHFKFCSASRLSCIDCGKVFGQQDVESHTQCIIEVKKYGPKGQVKASNGTNAKTKDHMLTYMLDYQSVHLGFVGEESLF